MLGFALLLGNNLTYTKIFCIIKENVILCKVGMIMQVVSGKLRGLKIITPHGEHTRPTLSRVKEAFFSSIQSDIIGSSFLDLFSGTGQIGLEALSRGAVRVVFVDNATSNLINENLKNVKSHMLDNNQSYEVLNIDIKSYMDSRGERFDYIYVDPPHSFDFLPLFEHTTNLLNKNGIVIIEQKTDKNEKEYEGFIILKHKVYGKTMLTYLRKL